MTTKPNPKLLVAMGDVAQTKEYTSERTAANAYLRELEAAELETAAALMVEDPAGLKTYLKERIRMTAVHAFRYAYGDGSIATRIKAEFDKAVAGAIKNALHVEDWSSRADLKGEYAGKIQAVVNAHAKKAMDKFEKDSERLVAPPLDKLISKLKSIYSQEFTRALEDLAKKRAQEDAKKALDLVFNVKPEKS